MAIQESFVAGQFYPDSRRELQFLLDKYIGEAEDIEVPLERIRAIIVPHAGYIYSGPVAGYGYRLLNKIKKRIKHVLLLGPSHHYPFTYLALNDSDSWDTLLGKIIINKKITNHLMNDKEFIVDISKYVEEHSLEVQLPFLNRSLSNFDLVPMCVGQSFNIEKASNELLNIVDDDTIMIVSSDLSHFLDYYSAVGIDNRTIDAILSKDAEYFDNNDNVACGYEGIKILITMAQKNNWKVKLLKYGNSGDVTGEKSRVVGYGSIAFYY